MKQEMISCALALADAVQRHPRRLAAALAALLLCAGGGAFAVAGIAPAAAPVRLLTEDVATLALPEQLQVLKDHGYTLYRGARTRMTDTPEALLKRLGLADPEAAAFMRQNPTVRQALFGRNGAGRNVTAEATERHALQSLRAVWLEDASASTFTRLVVEREGGRLTARTETAPLQPEQRLASGVIRTSLSAATDEAGLPDSVTRQMTEIFGASVDFHRGLRKGDRFAVVYEALLADGETMRTGRVLSAEVTNRGKTHQAMWFQENKGQNGGYFSFDGESLRRAYLAAPLPFVRITSGFGTRMHPVLGYSREHTGVDYAAPTGTPVRTIGDGVVEFAGTQNGYGNVVYIRHRNKKDSTVYAHLSRIDVRAGQRVAQGDTIGAVGATGIATGPHLHFEFRINNEPQDPTVALADQRESAPISVAGLSRFAEQASEMRTALNAASDMRPASFE